jgi:hypothetical protein
MEQVKSFKRLKKDHEIYFKEIDLSKVSNYLFIYCFNRTKPQI